MNFFQDQANFFEMKEKSRQIFVEILEEMIDRRSEFINLRQMQSWLYDQAYSKNREDGDTDLQSLIQKHLELKMKVTDNSKGKAIVGILQGADNFLSAQIKM